MIKLLKKLVSIFFNSKTMYVLVKIFDFFDERIKVAQGQVALNKVKVRGSNCIFHGNVKVYYPDKFKLGNNIRIGYGSFFFAVGGIDIGDNTQISRNVLIYSGNHDFNGSAIPYDDTYILKPVSIGKSVWIGMNVVITPGVTIGDGAIIGMGTVVSKDVPSGAIVVGAEQRIVKHRDMLDFQDKDKEGRHFAVLWPEN